MNSLTECSTILKKIHDEWNTKSSRSKNIPVILEKLLRRVEDLSLKRTQAIDIALFRAKVEAFNSSWQKRTFRIEQNQKPLGEPLIKFFAAKNTLHQIVSKLDKKISEAKSFRSHAKENAKQAAKIDVQSPKGKPRKIIVQKRNTSEQEAIKALEGVPDLTPYGAAFNKFGTAWIGYVNSGTFVLYWASKGQGLVEGVEAKILLDGQKVTATYPAGNLVIEMEISSNAASAAGASPMKTSSAKINGLVAQLLDPPIPVQLKAHF
jgi:NACalpha-BTF3-like transcription factor